jgi:hypothetical protein
MWVFAFVDDSEVRGKRVKDEEDEHMAVATGDIGLSCFGLEEITHKQQQKKKRLEQDISTAMKFQSWIERERGTALNKISLARNNAVVLWAENQGPKQQANFYRGPFNFKSQSREKKEEKRCKRDPLIWD